MRVIFLGSRAFLHSRFTSDRITDYCGNESVEPALEWKRVARRQNRAGLDLCNSRYPRKSSVPTAFKRAKKIQKKLVRHSRLRLKGNFEATNDLILSFKKIQKK